MKKEGRKSGKSAALLCMLVFIAALFFVLNLCMGSVSLSLHEVGEALFYGRGDTAAGILRQIRLPRACAGFLIGGALAVSGYLLQTFFHNPIAGPYVLGISSGAKLFVALAMILLAGKGMAGSSLVYVTAAFLGALLSLGIVLVLSLRVREMSLLIVAGIMIGYICSALTDFLVTFAEDAQIVSIHDWSRGSFSGLNMASVGPVFLLSAVCMGVLLFLAKPIRAYQLGEQYAYGLGVDLRMLRIALILISSLLSACATAYAGPVSFVGIAVPNILALLGKREDSHFMLPAAFLGGGAFCLFCDLVARLAFQPTELSISTVTAVFGAPVVLAVMLRRRRRSA